MKVQIVVDIPEGAKLQVSDVAPVTLSSEEQLTREHLMYVSEQASEGGLAETATALAEQANHKQNMAVAFARSNAVVAMTRSLRMVELLASELTIWQEWLWRHYSQADFADCQLEPLPPVEILEQIARAKESGLFDDLEIRVSKNPYAGAALFGHIGTRVYLLCRWSSHEMWGFDCMKQARAVRKKVENLSLPAMLLAVFGGVFTFIFGIGAVGATGFARTSLVQCLWFTIVMLAAGAVLAIWCLKIKRRHLEVFKWR